jgi:phage-related minor tail protein
MWDEIKFLFNEGVTDAYNTVTGWQTSISTSIKGTWNDITAFFTTIWDNIKTTFQNAWNWINTNIIQPMMNAINEVKSIGSSIGGGIGGAASAVGNFLHLASGGIVTQPTFALIGEAGPEAVVPLSGMTGSGSFGGGSGSININIGSLQGTDQAAAIKFANQIARILNQQLKLKNY